MKILVVNGGCLKVNSSANLCHIAYIKGFVDNGHDVTVLSTSEKGQIIDNSIILPEGPKYRVFERSILYNFINPTGWQSIQSDIQNNHISLKTQIIKWLKSILLKMYGPFGYNGVWVNNVVRHFGKSEKYDVVVSISSPVYSHLAAIKLIKRKKVSCKRHIEIWEDPWQMDLYNNTVNQKLLDLEHMLVSEADRVFYVSPLTAMYQKKLFFDCSNKIEWVPLPYYYKDNKPIDDNHYTYGYFGDYFPVSRNLKPFYEAARATGIPVVICGSPNNLFEPSSNIEIYPRLSLSELKIYEDKTTILVFLCNIKGGQIPGKIYQYSATNKKILFILDGTEDEITTIKDYFCQFNRYYFCRNDSKDIIKTIKRIENNADSSVCNDCIEYFSPQNITKFILDNN